ncbi:MAG: rare lipoprotein A (peptidoglycan hydrolase) [Hyphomicrobiaceae bacterium]|jgi:rare lipoprotein A (peptidoglycan hydrolase)
MSVLNGSTYPVRRPPTTSFLRTAAMTICLSIITAAAIIASPIVTESGAHAKTPGKTYCYNRICHRVLTLAETRRIVGRRTSVVASYYSHCRVDRFNPCGLTSSGARFQPSRADNAASPIYPNGTKLLVWNPANRRAAVIRIDNAGPYWRNRKLDLSTAAANKLGFRKRGVARLVVQVLRAPTRREARYRRHRKYAPVAGYIGRFTSMASALRSTGTTILTPRRRIAAANVTPPVRNTYLAERRIWLARMAEPRPNTVASITIAMAAPLKIRLPARLIRAEIPPARSKQRPRRRQRIASLSVQQKRSRTAKATRLNRLAKKASKLKLASKRKTIAKTSNVKKIKQAKSTGVAKASTKPAATQSKTGKPFAGGTTIKPKPNMAWRQRLLGINRSGA